MKKRNSGRQLPNKQSEEVGGCGAHSWPEGDTVTSDACCPELGRKSCPRGKSFLSTLCALRPFLLLPTWLGPGGCFQLELWASECPHLGGVLLLPPSTPRPFSLPTGKLVSPPPNHRKLSLSHLWRVLELSAVHIFGRELAVRPKLGVR